VNSFRKACLRSLSLAVVVITFAIVCVGCGSGGSRGETLKVDSITPDSGRQGTTVSVTLKGTDLKDPSWVAGTLPNLLLTPSDGIVVEVLAGSETEIQARFTIAADATLGARDVAVKFNDGTISGADVDKNPSFTVLSLSAPSITSVSPNPAVVTGAVPVDIIITGTGFNSSSRVFMHTGPLPERELMPSGTITSTRIVVPTTGDVTELDLKLTQHFRVINVTESSNSKAIDFEYRAPNNGSAEIAYYSSDSRQLHALNPDSGADRSIGPAGTDVKEPSWSPDRKWIAFARVQSGKFGIAVIKSDGSGLTMLTNTPGAADSQPRWSPNGSKIAFHRSIGSQEEIWVMKADGTEQSRLTNGFSPTWYPDSSKIAFTLNSEIKTIRTDGTGLTTVYNSGGYIYEPAVSPDGTSIAFRRYNETSHENEIVVLTVFSSTLAVLTFGIAPAWSPSGSQIVFVRPLVGGYRLWKMSSSGSGIVEMTQPAGNNQGPSWW
jgi:hypothetical protein